MQAPSWRCLWHLSNRISDWQISFGVYQVRYIICWQCECEPNDDDGSGCMQYKHDDFSPCKGEKD